MHSAYVSPGPYVIVVCARMLGVSSSIQFLHSRFKSVAVLFLFSAYAEAVARLREKVNEAITACGYPRIWPRAAHRDG